jgi:predicted ABC-type ATPase
MRARTKRPRCIVIAGPNGAGKTTFAREFLPKDAHVVHFVNADLIASGLSPLRPELAALTAGRLVLAELDHLSKSKQNFAFETTLSGQVYLSRLKRWKSSAVSFQPLPKGLSSIPNALRIGP